MYIYDHISLISSSKEKCFRQKLQKGSKTHILYSVTSFENRAVCEIVGKNIVEPDRPQMTIWCWDLIRGLKG